MIPILAGAAMIGLVWMAAAPAKEHPRRPRAVAVEDRKTETPPVPDEPARRETRRPEAPPVRPEPPAGSEEDPSLLAAWLENLPDAQLAALIGTAELDRYVARITSADPFRAGEFIERLNARIRAIRGT